MDTVHWQNGWWTPARRVNSPNYTHRPLDCCVCLAVIHNISLPPFEYGSNAVEALFTNRIHEIADTPFLQSLTALRVSSHFFIDRSGAITQFVSCDEAAHHAGVSSFRGKEGCNAFSIGIELEGCDFEPFSEAQYLALLNLLPEICQAYPIEAVCGHQHIAPGRKSDPGHFFDWQRLQEAGLPAVSVV
ncbi:1,6-anhydro-N-acetylmuramyl-L-alanine amidase AmpD [Stenoxybacter acetivorans]|uniref:1,6-anhydro-N-acetylmuramyl-L-alanine amidase AmpD n=1 Tax=Stenoxybacter acetivorans TaxID=422441 RepID=UPI00055AC086|nr:1,6-anhydro-N-acetylmuramyl-L-alanine amidase AmpD [Stenoxybacter acetivorans]